MASITLTLNGNSSQLQSQYFPPIDLSDGQYVCGLVDLQTYNSIPNVNDSNNVFEFGMDGEPSIKIIIPNGTYEVEDLAQYIQKQMDHHGEQFTLKANKNTLICEIICSTNIDFTVTNSIGPLFGFGQRYLHANWSHFSDSNVDIMKVNIIRVECNITKGSYINGSPAHTIHEFSPRVPPGYKISEVPNNVIYYPITVKSVSSFDISLIDQDNDLVDFRGERITIRIHIKKINQK